MRRRLNVLLCNFGFTRLPDVATSLHDYFRSSLERRTPDTRYHFRDCLNAQHYNESNLADRLIIIMSYCRHRLYYVLFALTVPQPKRIWFIFPRPQSERVSGRSGLRPDFGRSAILP